MQSQGALLASGFAGWCWAVCLWVDTYTRIHTRMHTPTYTHAQQREAGAQHQGRLALVVGSQSGGRRSLSSFFCLPPKNEPSCPR